MVKRIGLAVVVIAGFLQIQAGLSHASEIFLFIPGVKGESTFTGRTDWNNVQSISWGHEMPFTTSSTGGASVGRAVPDSIAFTKVVDSTSPALAFAATSGQPFPQVAIVEFVKVAAGGQPVVAARLELTGVRVTKYKASGQGSNSPPPTESVSLNYNTIKWIVERLGPDGRPIPKATGVAGWDFVNNKAF